jgi:hypothetical protein
VRGVLPGPLPRDGGIVHPLVVQLIVGDRVVLDTSVRPVAVRVDVRADVIGGQVESDVAVEVAVVSVAGVALARAPDLLRRLGVPREGRHARAAMDGRIAAVDGGRSASMMPWVSTKKYRIAASRSNSSTPGT